MRIHPSFIDIIFLLATFFITSTVLLVAYADQTPEVTLPALELAKTNSAENIPGDKKIKAVILSIKKVDGSHCYFLDDEQLTLEEIGRRLNAAKPRQVDLRVANDVIHAVESEIFDILLSAGIKEVAFVGITGSKGANP
jgi:biopolymer transport protein ExbD